jgi:hypothetical protein
MNRVVAAGITTGCWASRAKGRHILVGGTKQDKRQL